jgi:DNA primase
MDIIRLYNDFSIEIAPESHKHSRPGWVNTECPYPNCRGNPGFHLGWNEQEEYFFCWRCGWHPPAKTISLLLNVSESNAMDLMKQYGVNRTFVKAKQKDKKEFKPPSLMEDLTTAHRNYLNRRHFDSHKLEKLYNIKGTGPVSLLDKINYRHRIIIPYYWNGQIVSFDSRDITGRANNKYMACPEDREIIPRKSIIYGLQEYWEDVGICVEGPTDVWRLGKHAFAVSGIQYTYAQVKLISQIFKRVWVVFDPEPQAQRQANKLVAELRFRGVEANNIILDAGKDPGSLTQKEADNLVSKLLN